MSWTNIAKPTGTSYTNVNAPGGKEQYDQASLTYNDASTFYDGVNQNAWSNIAKPVGQTLGSEMIVNGTFATDLSGWTPINGGVWSNGSAYLPSSSSAYISQEPLGLVTGQTYVFEFGYQVTAVGAGINFEYSIGSSNRLSITPNSTNIEGFSLNFTASAADVVDDIVAIYADGGTNVYIDNVTLKRVTGADPWVRITKPT